jgi:hypothetical protein
LDLGEDHCSDYCVKALVDMASAMRVIIAVKSETIEVEVMVAQTTCFDEVVCLRQ